MPEAAQKSEVGGPAAPWARRLAWLGALFALELAAISALYTNSFEFTCRAVAPALFCGFMSLLAVRAALVVFALALFAIARPRVLTPLLADASAPWRGAPGLLIHGAGVAALLAPWVFLNDASPTWAFQLGIALWCGGAALAGLGAMFALARPQSWQRAIASAGWAPAPILIAAAALPDIALLGQIAWYVTPITDATFAAVTGVLGLLGHEPVLDPAEYHVGLETFSVLIGAECSGIEGFGLITAFMTAYLALFRRDLRFPNAILLIPIGLCLSWAFNVLRISTLILIGAFISPDLAAGGFHSHAGWLLFSALSIGLIVTSRQFDFFRTKSANAPSPAATPVFKDPVAAQLLPFAAFMFMGLATPAMAEAPATLYPVLIGVTLAVALLFYKVYAALTWQVDPISLAAGLAIGVVWLLAPAPTPEESVTEQVAGLGAAAFAVWAAVRVAGTSLVVPLVEEMFFRGYLLRRLMGAADAASPLRIAIAIGASSALFAALHDRWLLAGVAGVVYALLALRRGRIADAVQAHMASNIAIAVWALAMNDWDVI